MAMTSELSEISSLFFYLTVFLLSSLVTGPNFKSISWLELRKFWLVKDWPEIWKSQIPQSEFCPVSWDCDKLEILNLVRISLIKCYEMLQNTRVTAFTVFELLRENQLGGRGKITPPSQISVKYWVLVTIFFGKTFRKYL